MKHHLFGSSPHLKVEQFTDEALQPIVQLTIHDSQRKPLLLRHYRFPRLLTRPELDALLRQQTHSLLESLGLMPPVLSQEDAETIEDLRALMASDHEPPKPCSCSTPDDC